MNWKYIKPLKSADAIESFEKIYNFTFPDSFKEIVSKYNGARPELDVYDTDQAKERTIKTLLSFNKEDKVTIWKIAEWNKDELDDQYIAFAIDQFGNLICFSKVDQSIVFMNMETQNTELIAEDFSSFLGKLYTLN